MQVNTTTNPSIRTSGTRRNFMKNAGLAAAGLGGAMSVAPPVGAQETVSPDLQSLIRDYEALQHERDKINVKLAEIYARPGFTRQASITLSEVIKSPDMFPAALLSREIVHQSYLEKIFDSVKKLANFDAIFPLNCKNSDFDERAWRTGFRDSCDLLKARQVEKDRQLKDSGLPSMEARDAVLCDQQSEIMADIQAFECPSLADVLAKVSFASAQFDKYYDGCNGTSEMLEFIKTLHVARKVDEGGAI